MSTLLEEFKEYLKEMNQYDHVTGLLQWDMQTTVPKLGQAAHVDALTYFSTKSFEMGTSEKLGEFLEKLAQPAEYDALDDTWRFIVKRMKRDYDRNKRIPADLYEAFVRAAAESGNAWEEAKNASSGPGMRSLLAARTISLSKFFVTAWPHPDRDQVRESSIRQRKPNITFFTNNQILFCNNRSKL